MKKNSNKPTLPNQLPDIFLCYSHADYPAVRHFYQRLSRIGLQVWLDKEKLLPGQNWHHEIRKAILTSNLVIVCISQHFNEKKGYRHKELQIALKKAQTFLEDETFIIPVRLEECEMPKVLRHLQRVDLFNSGGYKKLLRGVMDERKKENAN